MDVQALTGMYGIFPKVPWKSPGVVLAFMGEMVLKALSVRFFFFLQHSGW